MEKTLEVEVQTVTQCSFIPFTPVPDGWSGKRVRVEIVDEVAACCGRNECGGECGNEWIGMEARR